MGTTSLKKAKQSITGQQALNDFFTCFSLPEARKQLHKMIRAAFAQKTLLDKKGVLDLLYLKEQLSKLLEAAETLAKDPANKARFEKFFHRRNARQWNESLDELFHAAAYDGFFTIPPADKDIYHTCRGLFKLTESCHTTHCSSCPK